MRKTALVTLALAMSAACSFSIAAARPVPDADPAAAGVGGAFPFNPPERAGPVVVRTAFHLRDINNIDDEAETFEFAGVLTLTWRDERQAFDPEEVGVPEKIYQGNYQFNEVFSGWFPQVVL